MSRILTMTADSIFISTSIPYVNGPPHVGFAWELVLADTLARYHRSRGRDVRFVTGTDDNSLKNVQAAERAGRPTADFVRSQGTRFVELAAGLGLSNDDFIRTASDPRHAPAVEKLWRACAHAGDIYTRSYRGLYCLGCEQFYAASELTAGRCPEHDTPLESVDEANYFFRLGRHQGHVAQTLSRDPLRGEGTFVEPVPCRGAGVVPEVYRAETHRWVEAGLHDFSISRSRERARGWGITVPGDATQTVYVWFDALANYVSALGYASGADDFERFWQRSARRIHVIGKNVTRFHCVYWPAILESAGLACPTDVVVHGFLTVEGRKIGKSLGNGVDPFALIERFGRDRLRHYLLACFPLGRDGDFSVDGLVRASNAELADQLGNLQNRVLVLLEQNAEAVVPRGGAETTPLAQAARATREQVCVELERAAPDLALRAILALVQACNLELARTEPWRIARRLAASPTLGRREELRSELLSILGEVARSLLWIAGLLAPFLPDTAERIAQSFGSAVPGVYLDAGPAWAELGAGSRLSRREVLFARLEGAAA
jgi:methionyl-tRNA synthetase